jgi:hypothetical protein
MSDQNSTVPAVEVEVDYEETEAIPVPFWVECHFCYGESCPECGWQGGAYVTENNFQVPVFPTR